MVFSDIADRLTRGVDAVQSTVSEAFFEPVLRLGVTGLSGAGKTVFITSLVANLLDRARMVQLLPAATGAIRAAYLRPQPDDTVPRFDYETHLGALLSPTPNWPQSTRTISALRLSLRVQLTGILGAISGPRTVHIDIIDYPGEWLLDLALLGKSYAQWSADRFKRRKARQKRWLGSGASGVLPGASRPATRAISAQLRCLKPPSASGVPTRKLANSVN